MNVILDGIDEEWGTAKAFQDMCHVGVQRIADGVGNVWSSVLGAKDEVNVNVGERLAHVLGRRFRTLIKFSMLARRSYFVAFWPRQETNARNTSRWAGRTFFIPKRRAGAALQIAKFRWRLTR